MMHWTTVRNNRERGRQDRIWNLDEQKMETEGRQIKVNQARSFVLLQIEWDKAFLIHSNGKM